MPKLKPTCPWKTKSTWSPWSQSGGWKVEELWRKRFVEKMSFDSGVEVRRSNGWWQYWCRRRRTDMCEITWGWQVFVICRQRSSLGSWFKRQGDAWRKERLLTFREEEEKPVSSQQSVFMWLAWKMTVWQTDRQTDKQDSLELTLSLRRKLFEFLLYVTDHFRLLHTHTHTHTHTDDEVLYRGVA